jgi:HlyD family secretion protein
MDKKRTKNTGKRLYIGLIIAALALGGVAYAAVSSGYRSTVRVERGQLTIEKVKEAPFYEYINITGQIEPRDIYYVDSKVAGNVETVFAEPGQAVDVGDTLLQLANADLQLDVLQRESQLIEQLNNQQQTALLLNQNNLRQQEQLTEVEYQLALQRTRYERSRQLRADSVIAQQDYEPVANRYQYLQRRQQLLQRAYQSDSIARQTQLQQMSASEQRIMQNLKAIRAILDRLYVTAAADGQLSDFTVQTGQAVESGERLGQIYSLEHPKIVAEIDEYYLNKVTTGQQGITTVDGDTLMLEVDKIYPTVEEGRFRVEISLEAQTAPFVRGQSVRAKLLFGSPARRTLLPNGSFYSTTGGSWVYVLLGDKAEKRPIKLGRRNPNYFEVLEGLAAGEQVITSDYENFKNYTTVKITN